VKAVVAYGLLFLMNKGKVLAYQNEFFGDIFVKILERTLGEGS